MAQLDVVLLDRRHVALHRCQCGVREGLRLLEPGDFFLQAIDLLFQLAERGFLASLLVDSILCRLPQPIARALSRLLNHRDRHSTQTYGDFLDQFRLAGFHHILLIFLI